MSKEVDKELKEAAPELDSLPKDHPFRTPENYFDGAEGKILQAINKQNQPQPLIRIFTAKKKWWLAAASIAALVIVIMAVLRNSPDPGLKADSQLDTTYLLFESVSDLPEAMVVEMYQQSIDVSDISEIENSDINYLIEASGIDPEYINSL